MIRQRSRVARGSTEKCAIRLRARYATPGTDLAYGATRCTRLQETILCSHYRRVAPLSGDSRAVQSAVLTERMVSDVDDAVVFVAEMFPVSLPPQNAHAAPRVRCDVCIGATRLLRDDVQCLASALHACCAMPGSDLAHGGSWVTAP
eukprot:1790102-Rhodomonas_salina.19